MRHEPSSAQALYPRHWLDLGLDALAEAGPAGLTIEALCARAGKTRGSFYAHFEGVEAFLAALAVRRRDTFTEGWWWRPNARRDLRRSSTISTGWQCGSIRASSRPCAG